MTYNTTLLTRIRKLVFKTLKMIFMLVLTLITLLMMDYLIRKRRNDLTADIPGPKSLPFVGNSLMYFNKNPEDIMYSIIKNRNKYGSLYKVWIFYKLGVFSCNPSDLEIVLSSPKYITKNTLYDLLYSWLGQGLLLSTESKWHFRRKIITPTFHFKILEQFVEIFDQQSSILIEKLRSHENDGKEFNIHTYIVLATLDVITETAMGIKINAQSDSECKYVRAVHELTEIIAKRFVNVWQRSDLIFSLTAPKMKKKQDDALKTLHNFTRGIIEERRKTLEKSDKKAEVEDDIGCKKRMALLDVLLQSSCNDKPLSNSDIQEEVDTFMFEGHDTTTSGICFTLYLISRHPEIQNKIYQEIREVLGDDIDKPLKYRDLMELKYLELVIKESLRLYPPVPIIGRLFQDDVNLNGKLIPAGTNYTVGIYVMFRDKNIFPDPDSFKPERHTMENTTEKNNPYAYIPFSAGPRNCIGQKFALLEMKCILSKILLNYELLPMGPDVRPVLNLVMRSVNGFHMGIKSRKP